MEKVAGFEQGGTSMSGQTLIRTMHLKQYYDTVFFESGKELKLTNLEINIILFLENHKEYNTARDLCRLRMIPKSNASNGIRLLERKGMLRIEYDLANKKIHRLFLTEKAHEATELLKKRQEEYLRRILGVLSSEEKAALDTIFEKMDRAAVNAMAEIDGGCPEETD